MLPILCSYPILQITRSLLSLLKVLLSIKPALNCWLLIIQLMNQAQERGVAKCVVFFDL